jgi:hypothetical protein
MLLGVTAWLAVGCGGLTAGGSGQAEDIQPPTPNPPWCQNCPEYARNQMRTEAVDPVTTVVRQKGTDVYQAPGAAQYRGTGTELFVEPQIDPTVVSHTINCEQVWPNQLEQLTRFRGYLAELWQVSTGVTRAWCDEQLRLVDSQISQVEANLSTCQ